ncbi:MAG: YqhA family protein [Streptosporangiaceae bacterium]
MAEDGDYVTRRAHGDEGPNGQVPAHWVRPLQIWVEWGLRTSRGLVVIAVLMLILSAAAAFAFGTTLLIAVLGQVALPAGGRIGLFLVPEAFLVGAALIIAGAGFYQLFVSDIWMGGLRRHLPRWLVIRDLADFSARMISMLVLIAAACPPACVFQRG